MADAPKQTVLVNPLGKLVTLPPEQVDVALSKYGYRPATTEEVTRRDREIQYGEGFGNELAAGVEGALSGATFGASRHLENILGITTPEAQAARKEFNPAASLTGELLGIGASTLALPGASLPGLVSKGTAKIGANVASRLASNEIAQQIAARTVGSAIEGAAYGVGQAVSEKALGDPTLTAQKVFHQIGLGALIGGGLGLATSALGVGMRKAMARKTPRQAESSPLFTEKIDDQLDAGASSTSQQKVSSEASSTTSLAQEASATAKADGLADAASDTGATIKTRISLNPDETKAAKALDVPEHVVQKFKSRKNEILARPSWEEAPQRIQQRMEQLNGDIGDLANQADELIEASGFTTDARPLAEWVESQIDKLKGGAATRADQSAINELRFYLEGTDDLLGLKHLKTMNASQIRGYMRKLREDIANFFSAQQGSKVAQEDYVIYKLQQKLDDLLKAEGNVPGYKEVMSELAPMMQAKAMFLKEFKTDTSLKDTFTRAIERSLYRGKGEPVGEGSFRKLFKSKAEAIKRFGDATGEDFFQWYDDIVTRRQLFPDQAKPMDWGTATANIFRMAQNLSTNPLGAAKDIVVEQTVNLANKLQQKQSLNLAQKMGQSAQLQSGLASKLANEADLSLVQKIRRNWAREVLLGQPTSGNIVESILAKIKDATKSGSSLLSSNSPLGSLLVPTGVKIQQFLEDEESLESADMKLEVLLALEKAQQKADQLVKKNVDGIFSDGNYKPKADKDNLPDGDLAEDLENFTKSINELSADPNQLLVRLGNSISGLGSSAPNIAASLNMTAARAISMLSEKLNAMQPQVKAPLDKRFVPNKAQMASLVKSMRYINDPFAVLDEIRTGLVSKEGKEVLMKVYPELYQELKGAVLNRIAQAQGEGKTIPMRKQIGLSYFVGQRLSSSLQPAAMAANQAAFAMPMATQSQPNPRAGSAKHLGVAGRAMTPLQKLASKE